MATTPPTGATMQQNSCVVRLMCFGRAVVVWHIGGAAATSVGSWLAPQVGARVPAFKVAMRNLSTVLLGNVLSDHAEAQAITRSQFWVLRKGKSSELDYHY